eukprot:2997866-Lingulodinium_polyedra.AAC.1
MLNDPKVERDNEGYKGRLQLWVPLGKKRKRMEDIGMESCVLHGGAVEKKPKDHDTKVLQDHARDREMNFSSDWMGQASKAQVVDREDASTT